MPPSKRQRLPSDSVNDIQRANLQHESRNTISDNSDAFSVSSSTDSLDTSEELASTKKPKSRQTSKRKIRATGPSNFGVTLQSLLNTDAPSALPLSLKPSISRKRNDEKLEAKAKLVLRMERKYEEDKSRITDVIGGWGAESERTLRKVAQRGVVKLFNAVQQSQASASAADEEAKAVRGSGKPTLPAPVMNNKGGGKGKTKDRDNAIGRAKESTVNKNEFFDMIRIGGVVSKA